MEGGIEMKLKYKLIPEGISHGVKVPISVALVDYKDILDMGISMRQACEIIAKDIPGPAAINIFDMDAVTTTSDGIMIDGAIVCMAASDYGRIDKDFGFVEMMEMPDIEKLIPYEPHLKQLDINYKGRKLVLGPDPDNKPVPVHNAVMSGRAGNNNSATEIMHFVTMDEMLLPVIGQMEIMRNGDIEIGMTGFVMSVGIGFIVPEQYGRIVPRREFPCGDTSHRAGKYSKYLKSAMPCIVADKKVLSKYIIKALKAGMIPGRDISPSPSVLSIAKYMGIRPDYNNITNGAYYELADVGFTKEWLHEKVKVLPEEEIVERARHIIPGVDSPIYCKAEEIAKVMYVEV